jgi:hypothetical protein
MAQKIYEMYVKRTLSSLEKIHKFAKQKKQLTTAICDRLDLLSELN